MPKKRSRSEKKSKQRHSQQQKSESKSFEFRDRSGKLHRTGGSKPERAHSGHHARPQARPQAPKEREPREKRLKATVDKNHKGFAFLIFEDRGFEDLFIPPRESESFFHGDRVEVTILPKGEVQEIKVLEHRFRELVGRYEPHSNGRGAWVVYERKRAREEVFIPKADSRARGGDWVRAKLHFHENGPMPVTAEVTEVYGPMLPASADIGMVAAEYNLVEEHSRAAVQQAESMTLEIPGRDLEGRLDLRDVPFITIDGETARDFDDAVYVEKSSSGYILWVAIADVSHYVSEGSALDREAYSRGTSVYFPEKAFHMLPRALSENLCSLRPKEPRLAMVSKIECDSAGRTVRTELYEAVIESRRRATYNEIQAEWEANGKNPGWEFAPHFSLYQKIRKLRRDRGSIDFDLPEADLYCDSKTGEVIHLKQRERLDAHRLIEEFMIAANEAVTEWMMKRTWPFVYRIHEEPDFAKLEKFRALAATVGVHFTLERPDPKILADLVSRFENHPASALLNTSLLRSMRQAVYSATHGIHFGLASKGYTHFTSPIRRYPDLVVHRLLREALRAEKKAGAPKGTAREQLEEQLAEICEHCSYRERLASDAERESIRLKRVRVMIPRLGEEFEGKINGMVDSGMFVELSEPYVEGLISKESLTDDFYEFNEERMVFSGRRKKRTFQIGDRVVVRALKADIDTRQIDFGLVSVVGEKEPGARKNRPR